MCIAVLQMETLSATSTSNPSSLNLSEFWGICIDSSGHTIATDCKNGVYVFKPSGECVGHVSSGVIVCPAGVTVDEDGFVYVCDDNVVVL